MTRVLLINAGPTPWDMEERIAGNVTLPLAPEAHSGIAEKIQSLPQIDTIYHCKSNEACHQVAKMIASARNLKARDNAQLDAWCLGLWQGLRLEDLRQRYPSAIEQWEEAPATVMPPEGEGFLEAIARLREALQKILRRNRGHTVALVLRPSALHIAAGLLRRQSPEQIAVHLRNEAAIETIEVEDESLKEL